MRKRMQKRPAPTAAQRPAAHAIRSATAIPALVLLGCAAVSHAGIVGSKHDFSGRGWGSDEVCIFCHTPHNAIASVGNSPLWNQRTSAATYTLYGSPTSKEAAGQPRAPSKLCLSCHDGTIAVGSFGGRTGMHFVAGAVNLGTDLSNDHPISVYWNHQTLAVSSSFNCLGCHFSLFGLPTPADNLPFYDRRVECPTCHEPHDQGLGGRMLRKTMNQSSLCMHCH
jgi:predicted CXXCH cytochrome family protein